MKPPNFSRVQPLRAGASSLMKMPRYFTAGSRRTWRPGSHEERVALANGHVRPPVPGRDADLLRDVVDPEDRPALVAAGDDQRARDAGPGARDDLDDRRLPAALDLPDVELAGADETVDLAAPAERAHDHDVGGRRASCRAPGSGGRRSPAARPPGGRRRRAGRLGGPENPRGWERPRHRPPGAARRGKESRPGTKPGPGRRLAPAAARTRSTAGPGPWARPGTRPIDVRAWVSSCGVRASAGLCPVNGQMGRGRIGSATQRGTRSSTVSACSSSSRTGGSSWPPFASISLSAASRSALR